MNAEDISVGIETKPAQALYAFLAFFCAALLTAGPILLHAHLPLVDLPNHIARHSISTTSGRALDAYYTYDFKLVPNNAVDVAWLALGRSLDPTRFSQLTMAFYSISLIGSVMGLSRFLHGYWSAWPAASALIVYNANFFWGFQNFLVTVPFAIVGLTLLLWSERLSVLQRLMLLSPFVLLLYYMHFFAFSALAVTAFGREAQRIYEAGKDYKSALSHACLIAIPYVIPILWLLANVLLGPENPSGSKTLFGPLHTRLAVIGSISLGISQALPIALKITGWIIIFAVASLAVVMYRPIFGKLEIAPQMRGPLVALILAALLSPVWLNGVALVHIRFGFIVVAFLFAASHWQDLTYRKTQIVVVAVLAILLVRGFAFERYAASHEAEVLDFIELAENVPAGERLLPVYDNSDVRNVTRLWHVAANAVTYHDVFVPTLFQGLHGLKLKPKWHTYAIAAGTPVPARLLTPEHADVFPYPQFFQDWEYKFTYLVMLSKEQSELKKYSVLREIASNGRFTLYQIDPRSSLAPLQE